MTTMRSTTHANVRRYRERMRAKGHRKIQLVGARYPFARLRCGVPPAVAAGRR